MHEILKLVIFLACLKFVHVSTAYHIELLVSYYTVTSAYSIKYSPGCQAA